MLIDAADEVFRHFGFKKASIEDIAKIAGVGKGSVYLHFESKEALFEAVLRQILSRGAQGLEATVEAATSPLGKLRAFVEERMAQGAEIFRFGFNGLQGDASALSSLAEFAGVGKKVMIEFRDKELALLGRILDEGRTTGVFHVSDTDAVAMGLLGVTYAGIARMASGGDAARKSLTVIFDLLLRGLQAEP